MKRHKLLLLGTLVSSMTLVGCGQSAVDSTNIVFSEDDLVQSSFGGLGVEWGVYEDADKLDDYSWQRIYANAEKLAPTRIRCMINYDWFVTNFDDKGDDDKSNDTWDYDFANQWGENLTLLLTYCQTHNIQVAFGSWNVVGSVTDDVWGMMDECTSDIRWAKMSAFVMDYLINKQGFTCIRWFVNGNEPNYLGVKGSSKNYNNSFAKWSQGVKNVRTAFDAKGLTNLGIVGGDTTGLDGTTEYFTGIANNISDKVSDYGTHLYMSNYNIDGGYVLESLNTLNEGISKLDKGYGTTRPLDVWESGLLDGKNNETDGNTLIKTVSYGVRMADFTIQSALGGINSIVYWDFDDGMNFMYSGSTAVAKKWGMFSSLAADQPYDQELRPWFHSSCLLTHLLSKGSKIYGSNVNSRDVDPNFRTLGVVNSGDKSGGYIAINRGSSALEKSFVIDKTIEGSGKLYIYYFGEGLLRLGSDGFVTPNYVIDGSLTKRLSLSIPANSFVLVSSEVL
jgi:hypothetical protein